MLIKDGRVVDNSWEIVAREESIEEALSGHASHLLVPLKLWQAESARLREAGKDIGLWLDTDEEPESIEDEVNDFPVIALNFPKFTDGRAFSSAVVLRRHRGFSGELRAIGDVQRDPLFYMKRCGFDAFDMAENVSEEDALSAFNDFRNTYASSVEQPEPLFKRR